MRIIIADCEIDYEGRASSSLSSGERIILIKNDNTILIHTENNFKPINYMPKSDLIEFRPNIVDFNTISAIRKRPHETITVYIKKMLHDIKIVLKDEEDFLLKGSEKDLQEYLYDNPSKIHPQFRMIGKEYQTAAGSVDLFGINEQERYTVIEIKRVKGSLASVSQLKRYHDTLSQEYNNLHAILISDGITPSALNLLNRYGFQHINLSVRDI